MHLQEAVPESKSIRHRETLSRAAVLARAAIAAAGFCSSVIVGLQACSTWASWSQARAVRLEVATLSVLSQVHWGLEQAGTASDNANVVTTVASEVVAKPKGPTLVRSARPKAPRAETARIAKATVAAKHAPEASVGAESKTGADESQSLLLKIALERRSAFHAAILAWNEPPKANSERVLTAAASVKPSTSKVLITHKQKTANRPVPQVARSTLPASPLAMTNRPQWVANLPAPALMKPRPQVPAPNSLESSVDQTEQATAQLPTQNSMMAATQAVDRIRSQSAAPQSVLPATWGSKSLTRDSQGSTQWAMVEGAGVQTVLFSRLNTQSPQPLRADWVTTQATGSAEKQAGTSWISSAATSGSVSGWITEGETVRVLGSRAEVHYFSLAGEPTSAQAEGQKFFIANGVRPGAAVVQALSRGGAVVQVAGLPVLAGSTSQVDFRAPVRRQVRGRLFSADQSQMLPIGRAEIRIVGMPERVLLTGPEGRFDFGAISIPAGLPLYVEARLPQGFTHRYALSEQTLLKPVSLYRFGDERVQGWVSALEGGVSAESGLIVSAAPAKLRDGALPVVKALAKDAATTPETYWLGKGDELLEPGSRAVSATAYQPWIGVEVPAGAALVGLQSARGRWLSVDWFPVSPGVVGVITPNE